MPIYVTKNRTNTAELLCMLEYDWYLNMGIGSEKIIKLCSLSKIMTFNKVFST